MLPNRTFYYLRHGETDWNLQRLAQGHRDIPLNETGRRQAREAAKSALGLGIERIVTSPLSRAAETARTVGDAIGIVPENNSDLKECSFGEQEGNRLDPWIEGWLDGSITIPGADVLEEFIDRSGGVIRQILEQDSRPTLIVAHGVVYRGVQKLMQQEQLTVPNGVILEHRPDQEAGWRVFMR